MNSVIINNKEGVQDKDHSYFIKKKKNLEQKAKWTRWFSADFKGNKFGLLKFGYY